MQEMKKQTDLNEYFRNAEKMIPWKLTVESITEGGKKREDRYIDVPSAQWGEAKENLTIRHLIKDHGFILQDCIPYETRLPLEVKFKDRIAKEVKSEWGIGVCFKIVSTDTKLEIISNIGGLELKYIEGEKLPIRTNEIQVERMLKLGVWVRI